MFCVQNLGQDQGTTIFEIQIRRNAFMFPKGGNIESIATCELLYQRNVPLGFSSLFLLYGAKPSNCVITI